MFSSSSRLLVASLCRLPASPLTPLSRLISTSKASASASASASNVTTDKDSSGIVTFSLNRKPVNSFTLEFIQEMITTLDSVQNDPSTRGIIFTSGLTNNVFSGGFDLNEFVQEEERLRAFWAAGQDLWLRVLTCPKPTAAAVNGHCPAGGLIFSTCSDYRVMVRGKAKTGLNETKFGLVVPFWLASSFRYCVGSRQADEAMLLGRQYSADEAHTIGLIDTVVDSKEEALSKCAERLAEQNQCVQDAVYMTKLMVREELVDKFHQRRDKDTDLLIKLVADPKIKGAIEAYIAMLKAKKQ